MLKIKVNSLKPGVTLGKDLFSYDSKLLLSKGTIITREHLDSLQARNIEDVFIMDSKPIIKSGRQFEDVYSDSLDVVRSFMLEAKLGKPLEFDDISAITGLLLEQVFEANDLFRQMRLMKEKDDYLFTHSVNVALLCILMGRWLKCEHETLKELGQAGLLHDIGKIFISSYRIIFRFIAQRRQVEQTAKLFNLSVGFFCRTRRGRNFLLRFFPVTSNKYNADYQ